MKYLIVVSGLICFSYCHAQKSPLSEADLQNLIERTFAFQDEDIPYDELYETLLLYYENPLNLNNASASDLNALLLLSPYEIESLLKYRATYGELISIYELQAVFDLETINRIRPFVTINETGFKSDGGLLRRIMNEDNNYLLLRYERTLENKEGYERPDTAESRYLGSQGRYYARFRVSHTRDFSLGFTLEKDAGETYDWDPHNRKYGVDYYSFHFHVQDKGRWKDIIVGDYQVQYGQSLVLGAGFNVGKGSETINTLYRSNSGIRPYTSVVETNFFRGVAGTYSITKNLDFTGFYSRLYQDAVRRVDSTDSPLEFISSIQNTGFHRTPSELAARDKIAEQSYGGTLLYHTSNLQVGTNIIFNRYSLPIIKSGQLYNYFAFTGTQNHVAGIFINYQWENVTLFGETGRSKSGGYGGVGGLIISLTSQLSTSLIIRDYQPDFHSFYGNAFAESSGYNQNEKGWYWGLKYVPNGQYWFTAYFDQFSFPWLTFNSNKPSSGYEYLFRASYQPKRDIILYAQYRRQLKPDDPSAEEQFASITYPLDGIKDNYLINADYQLNDHISAKTRVQWSTYNFNDQFTNGFALMQDINISLGRFKIGSRFAVFDTDNYENRQYAYERDILYAFSIPAYNGIGSRNYLLFQYNINRNFDVWLRYARTRYRNRESISSGLEEIDGDKKTDVKMQVRIKF